MKTLIVLFIIAVAASGCGYAGRDSEATGQVKQFVHNTPVLCPNWDELDMSLGVMRDGTGSVSKQDIFLTVQNDAQKQALLHAVETGALVKITYDTARFRFCTDEYEVTRVQVLGK